MVDFDIKSLPKEVWYGIAAGVGVLWYMRSRNSNDAIPETGEVGSYIDTGGVAGVGTGGSGMWTNLTPGVDGDEAPVEAISTNTAWRKAATDALVEKNYSAILADDAINRYINGMLLSPSQSVLVSEAIKTIGSVPEDLPPAPVAPPPVVPIVSNPTPTKLPAPKNLRSTAIGTDYVSLAWDAVVGAKKYEVDRSGDNLKYGTTANSITIRGLKPGTQYNMIVRGINGVGTPGSWTATKYFTTKK